MYNNCMSDAGVNTEGIDHPPEKSEGKLSKFLKAFKEKFKRRKTNTTTNTEIPKTVEIREMPTIPDNSGYIELIRNTDGKLSQELKELYPELASLLSGSNHQTADQYVIDITSTWGMKIDQAVRGELMQGLKDGNKKVIAVLAYYLSEKSKGDLPLETMTQNQTMNYRQARRQFDETALSLMRSMESMVTTDEQKRFSASENRAKWSEILFSKESVMKQAEAILKPLPNPSPPSQR